MRPEMERCAKSLYTQLTSIYQQIILNTNKFTQMDVEVPYDPVSTPST